MSVHTSTFIAFVFHGCLDKQAMLIFLMSNVALPSRATGAQSVG